MDKEVFRKLLVQWANEDVYIGHLTWEEGDALAEYLAKWYAIQQGVKSDGANVCPDCKQVSNMYRCESCGCQWSLSH